MFPEICAYILPYSIQKFKRIPLLSFGGLVFIFNAFIFLIGKPSSICLTAIRYRFLPSEISVFLSKPLGHTTKNGCSIKDSWIPVLLPYVLFSTPDKVRRRKDAPFLNQTFLCFSLSLITGANLKKNKFYMQSAFNVSIIFFFCQSSVVQLQRFWTFVHGPLLDISPFTVHTGHQSFQCWKKNLLLFVTIVLRKRIFSGGFHCLCVNFFFSFCSAT